MRRLSDASRAPRRTRRLMVQQEALRLYIEQLPARRRELAREIDLVDAALLDHVAHRLTVRKCQRMQVHAGVPVVWVHFPTVAAENWLLRLSPGALGRRFRRLVDLGLLVRLHVPLGSKGGSRTYFGLSQAWRGVLEGQETAPTTKADMAQKPGHSDRDEKPGRYEAAFKPGQSLSVSLGVGEVPRQRRQAPSGDLRSASRPSASRQEGEEAEREEAAG